MFQNNRGLTLIELMVVITIIVILSSLTAITIRYFKPNTNLKVAAKDIRQQLNYAKQRSITEQIIYGIFFDSINDNYQLICFSDSETTLATKQLPEQIQFQSISGFINQQAKFTSLGYPFQSGQIILVNNNNKTISINIRPSGYIRID